MPNIQDLQQYAGALITVILVILSIVFGVANGDKPDTPAQPSQPTTHVKTVRLAGQSNQDLNNVVVNDNATVGGTTYPKSLMANWSNNSPARVSYTNLGRYSALDGFVGFDTITPPAGILNKPEERHGQITIKADNRVVAQVKVGQGQVVPIHADISHMRESLVIEYDIAYSAGDTYSWYKDFNGLTLLSPKLTR